MLNTDSIFGPPPGWTDTEEQANVRACVSAALQGKDPIDQIKIASGLIMVLRDQLLTAVAEARKDAALVARETMEPHEIVEQTGLTKATVSRLLYEGRRG